MYSIANLLVAAMFALPAAAPEATPATGDADASVAELEAALAAWDASCKKKGAHGLCVQMTPPATKARKGRCAPRRLGAITVRSRGKRGDAAYKKLAAAVKKAEALPDPSDVADKAALQSALAEAKIALADRDLETYIAVTVPANLDFYVEEWKRDSGLPKWEAQYEIQVAKREASTKKFKAFFDEKTKLGGDLMKRYAKLKKYGDGEVVIEAALKTAWLSQNFADELVAAPIPKSIKKDEVKDAYCDALADQSKRPEKMAQDAATYCTDKASENKITGAAANACKELLDSYPAPAKPKTK